MRRLTVAIIVTISSFLFSENFSLKSKMNGVKTLQFSQQELSTIQKDGYLRLTTPEEGSTVEDGMPELPVYTTFFQMKRGVKYEVEYEVISSHQINDVEIYPYQGEPLVGVEKPFIKNLNFYTSNESFPESKLTVSEPMVLRDIEVGLVSFTPFNYDAFTKTLTVYDEVEIYISENGTREENHHFPAKRSKLLEPLYEEMIVDYEPLSSRDEYQPETIMYICGGAAATHPYVRELEAWRETQGYVVHTVSTSETGSSASAIENYLENIYETWQSPPEIVGLIGDTGGTYAIGYHSYEGGATDVDYSYLSGNDFLPELYIGRISVNSSSDISNLINKTLTYEKAEDQADWWYEKAALVGDPSTSGISTITTMQYVENIMENYGMDNIQTNYGNGNFDSWVENQFDSGILYYNYRGYYGSSSIGQSGLNSGIYAPFAATVTCGTGDFNGTSESESFVRAGSLTSPQGAVACVGVSTLNTHTAYNNIVHMGMYEGIFSKGMYHAGAALANGKVALYKTYPTNPNYAVSRFSAWPNLIGDPALHLWTDVPKDFNIDAPTTIPESVSSVEVNITDEYGYSVTDARVVLAWGSDFFTGYTNENGSATINWSGDVSGHGQISVFKKGFRLAQQSIAQGIVEGPSLYLDQNRFSVNDAINGNSNNLANANESITVEIPITNLGNETARQLLATLSAGSEKVDINNPQINIDSINPNDDVVLSFDLHLAGSIYQSEELQIQLQIEDINEYSWSFNIPLIVFAPKLELSEIDIVEDRILMQGIESDITLSFKNNGAVSATNLMISLNSDSRVQVTPHEFYLPNMGAAETINFEDVSILPSTEIINGEVIHIPFEYVADNGIVGTDFITFSVGERDVTDPLGPDEYGYYIYDSGDTDYAQAPTYNWIEIVNNGGTQISFNDGGDGESSSWGYSDDTETIQLPFDFQFYGIVYDEITVSTNGWIAFGESDMSSFRNYSIPGAGGPSPMVAGFWDDLTTDGSGDVYYLSNNDYVIIQWDSMSIHGHNNSQNTFQMILYNPSSTYTPTGDGEIKVQYQEFRNVSDGDYYQYTPLHGCYASIGVENHLGNIGLEYTFDDEYPDEAMELGAQTAIYITTYPPEELPQPALTLSQDSFDLTVDAESLASESITIGNDGEAESVLSYNVNVSYPDLESPFAVTGGGPDLFGYFWSDSDIDVGLDYGWVDISEMGSTVEFSNNDDGTPFMDIGFAFPFYGEEYTQFLVNPNGWIGFESDNDEWYNGNLTDSGPQAAIMAFWDDLNPVNNNCNASCEGNVYYYSDGSQLIVSFNNVAHWVTEEYPNSIYNFQVIIDENGQIQINYGELNGGFSATVGIQNSDASSYVQVADYLSNYYHDGLSLYFENVVSYHNWLNIDSPLSSGSLFDGESVEIDFSISTVDMPEDDYVAYLNVSTNVEGTVQIPINLSVGEGALPGDVNTDGVVNVLDVVQIVNYVLGNLEFNASQVASADMNDDGIVNVLDIVTLVNSILTF